MLVALLALFAGTAGVSYAATQGPPSFTARGVALVSGTAFNPTPLPISGADASAISNHGMSVSGTTRVVVPVSGNYLVTLNGNCNGGAASPRFQVREGSSRRPARSTSTSAARPATRRWRARTPCTWPRERGSG